MGPGFFLEHGRPEIGISDSKPVVFWPDEWENVLHGIFEIQLPIFINHCYRIFCNVFMFPV